MPRPEIIAHRGTPRVHPENSLPGFAHAVALGVDGIELDVHLTRDGVPVVHHDPELAAGPAPLAGRPIAQLMLDELRSHELAPRVTIPTLAEVRALTDGRTTLYVEVKAREAGHVVADLLASGGERTPVHSFDHRLARGVRLRAPRIPVGVLSVSYLVDTVGAMRAAEARDLWQHWSMIDAPLVDAVHAAGGRVLAWTVNDPEQAVALARLGVDGLCSDVPDVIAPALAHACT
jgi:glycerophosphoryl diester phosphodiesterase